MANFALDELLETLRAIMPGNPAAKFRLRDILPVEISLVDRAANKRRFLTIKHSDGVNIMPTLLKVDLPASVREKADDALSDALRKLHELTAAVKEGEALTTEDAKTPEEFQKALGGVVDVLDSIVEKEAPSELGTEASDKLKAIAAAIASIAEADSPESVTDMIGRLLKLSEGESKEAATLKALGELSIALCAEPKEDGALPVDTMEKVQVLTTKLGELVGAEPAAEPAAKIDEPVVDNTPSEPEPAAKTDEPAQEPAPEPQAEPETEPAPAVEDDELAKAFELITARAIEKAGAKMSQSRLSRMRSMLKALSDLVEELSPAIKANEGEPTKKSDTPEPDPIPPTDPPAVVAAQPEEVTKMRDRIKTLEQQISTLSSKPVAPASRKVESATGTGAPSSVPVRENPPTNRWIWGAE